MTTICVFRLTNKTYHVQIYVYGNLKNSLSLHSGCSNFFLVNILGVQIYVYLTKINFLKYI